MGSPIAPKTRSLPLTLCEIPCRTCMCLKFLVNSQHLWSLYFVFSITSVNKGKKSKAIKEFTMQPKAFQFLCKTPKVFSLQAANNAENVLKRRVGSRSYCAMIFAKIDLATSWHFLWCLSASPLPTTWQYLNGCCLTFTGKRWRIPLVLAKKSREWINEPKQRLLIVTVYLRKEEPYIIASIICFTTEKNICTLFFPFHCWIEWIKGSHVQNKNLFGHLELCVLCTQKLVLFGTKTHKTTSYPTLLLCAVSFQKLIFQKASKRPKALSHFSNVISPDTTCNFMSGFQVLVHVHVQFRPSYSFTVWLQNVFSQSSGVSCVFPRRTHDTSPFHSRALRFCKRNHHPHPMVLLVWTLISALSKKFFLIAWSPKQNLMCTLRPVIPRYLTPSFTHSVSSSWRSACSFRMFGWRWVWGRNSESEYQHQQAIWRPSNKCSPLCHVQTRSPCWQAHRCTTCYHRLITQQSSKDLLPSQPLSRSWIIHLLNSISPTQFRLGLLTNSLFIQIQSRRPIIFGTLEKAFSISLFFLFSVLLRLKMIFFSTKV